MYCWSWAVSYTHLDVYKRQLLECFRKQHNILFKTISGEGADVPVHEVGDWKRQVSKYILTKRITLYLQSLMRLDYILELYQIIYYHKTKQIAFIKVIAFCHKTKSGRIAKQILTTMLCCSCLLYTSRCV